VLLVVPVVILDRVLEDLGRKRVPDADVRKKRRLPAVEDGRKSVPQVFYNNLK
jgi:hypothetical protein